MEPVVPFPHELHPVPARHGGEEGSQCRVPVLAGPTTVPAVGDRLADVVEQGAGGRGVSPEILPGSQLLGGAPGVTESGPGAVSGPRAPLPVRGPACRPGRHLLDEVGVERLPVGAGCPGQLSNDGQLGTGVGGVGRWRPVPAETHPSAGRCGVFCPRGSAAHPLVQPLRVRSAFVL